MKNNLYAAAIAVVFFCIRLNAQNTFPSNGAVGISTTSPNKSSLLEIKSTSKGILIPRMTKIQRDAIASPATGLLIYQTNSTPGFYYYSGTGWTAVTPKAKSWSLTGNTGTDPSTNFLGTIDAQPLVFKVNNNKSGIIDYNLGTAGFGYLALNSNTAVGNTAFGYEAGYFNTSGQNNTALGNSALQSNTTGVDNTATGAFALYSGIGNYNTANGYFALGSNSANNNTSTGALSLHANTSGYDNVANGYAALYANTTGTYNTAAGSNAMHDNTDGFQNVAEGWYALSGNTTGGNNVAIGPGALKSNGTGGPLTGIGAFTDVNADGYNNSAAIGYNAFITASNQVRIGNGSVTSIGGYVNWSNISDGRVKKNIKENVPGLTFINKLQPVTYNLDLDAADKIIQQSSFTASDAKIAQLSMQDKAERLVKEKIIYTGFIAQDVQKVAKEIGYDFSGIDAAKNDKDLYGLRYADFVVPLVKAVQELSTQNNSLESEVGDLRSENASLEQRLAKLEVLMNIQSVVTNLSSASIQQNIPNPFSHTTTINYSLPQKYSSAKIIVTDKSGKVLKQITLSPKGNGSVNLNASTLAAGAYQYSLIVDGKVINTKQMLLAK